MQKSKEWVCKKNLVISCKISLESLKRKMKDYTPGCFLKLRS